jgi:hypothetical protein
MKNISGALSAGYCMFIDYGEDLIGNFNGHDKFRTYPHASPDNSPYAEPTFHDETTNADFGTLYKFAFGNGFSLSQYGQQGLIEGNVSLILPKRIKDKINGAATFKVILFSKSTTPPFSLSPQPSLPLERGWKSLTNSQKRRAAQAFRGLKVNISGDRAMSFSARKNDSGGIDFAQTPLVIRNTGQVIIFHLDPTQLAQLQRARGLVPRITRMERMINLRVFLGLNPV